MGDVQQVVQEILDELVGTGAELGVQVAAFVDGRAAGGSWAGVDPARGLALAVAKSVISHDFDTLAGRDGRVRPGRGGQAPAGLPARRAGPAHRRCGNDDLCSFYLSALVLEMLRFVHDAVRSRRNPIPAHASLQV
jgi:hypothetical protein